MLHYYMGDAQKGNDCVWVLMLAKSKADAHKRYKECVKRHPELTALTNPQIAELGNAEEFIQEHFTRDMLIEFLFHFSVSSLPHILTPLP